MSLRIIPPKNHPTTFTHSQDSTSAPSVPSLHDTLRAGIGPSLSPYSSTVANPAVAACSSHPLEARLLAWRTTQHSLRMELLRRTYGMAEPVRREMELKIVREGSWRPAALAGGGRDGATTGSVHEDILTGRDDTIDWEDVFTGGETRPVLEIHDEMERKLKI